ncbi:AAA family ATPase [Daejeonella lutea]|uniref:AAA domain-containing protein, putative AbiEii toxin, Type IV TA system n=1 Tax=Daejeonella lutea TaxID=572036 RepID=A0A1T5AZX5_9SPHI|nr:AAA family ATPase [Daejeonella lutea]SKB40525.1 AAA domain-containing protein, putative AbiEii toxin, Type IV TA system [Daejeonella lutea]
MKVTEFSIANFKSFSNYQAPPTGVASGLRTINMIYGENNSGKSNILKFIDIVFSGKISREAPVIVEGALTQRDQFIGGFWQGVIMDQPFIYHKNERTRVIEIFFKVEILNDEIEDSGFEKLEVLLKEFPTGSNVSTIEFKAEIKNFKDPYTSLFELKEAKLNGLEIYADITGSKKRYFNNGATGHALYEDSVSFESLISILNNKVLFLDNDRYYSKEIDTNSLILTTKNFKNWLYKLSLDPINYKKYEKFKKFVRDQSFRGVAGRIFKDFDPTYSNVNGEIELNLSNGSDRLPISSFGTGIHQILFLLTLIFETKAKILLIEELELNLSPQSQRELLQIFRRLIGSKVVDQVIFTTHSPYLRSTTDFSIYEVSMNSVGVSQIENKAAVRPSFFNYKRH